MGELDCVKYYKKQICSKEIFHVTVGHSTRTAKISLFKIDHGELMVADSEEKYSRENKYLIVDKNINSDAGDCQSDVKLFVKLDFGEKPILFFENSLFIASKLDLDT